VHAYVLHTLIAFTLPRPPAEAQTTTSASAGDREGAVGEGKSRSHRSLANDSTRWRIWRSNMAPDEPKLCRASALSLLANETVAVSAHSNHKSLSHSHRDDDNETDMNMITS
jgi:hypothetical protein